MNNDPTLAARLFSPRQIGMAALAGSPLAAGWLFRRNEYALGRPEAAGRWLWRMVAATAAVLVVSFFLPDRFPPFIIPFAYSYGLRAAARNLYDVPISESLAHGGARQSWWTVAGISLVCLVIVLGVFVSVAMLLPDQTG